MEGIVKIEDYRIHCIIGEKSHERENEQEISLDIEFKVDLSEAVLTDSIVDTVDYEKVALLCADLAKSRKYRLLETFAFEAVNEVFNEFSVIWCRVEVRKKSGLALAKSTSVVLEKKK